jgi:hypothetical protein
MKRIWKSLLFFVVITPVLITLGLTLLDATLSGHAAWSDFGELLTYVYVLGLVLFIFSWMIDITIRSRSFSCWWSGLGIGLATFLYAWAMAPFKWAAGIGILGAVLATTGSWLSGKAPSGARGH